MKSPYQKYSETHTQYETKLHFLFGDEHLVLTKEDVVDRLNVYPPTRGYPYPSLFSDGHYDESSTVEWFINKQKILDESELEGLLISFARGQEMIVEIFESDGCC